MAKFEVPIWVEVHASTQEEAWREIYTLLQESDVFDGYFFEVQEPVSTDE